MIPELCLVVQILVYFTAASWRRKLVFCFSWGKEKSETTYLKKAVALLS